MMVIQLVNARSWLYLWCFYLGLYCITATESDTCDKLKCAPIVSKCLLTQSCQCKLSDCYCCKDCIMCLGRKFTECCGCLDICPKPNGTSIFQIGSQIGDFDGLPELFNILVNDKTDELWTIVRIPMRDTLKGHFLKEIERKRLTNSLPLTANCTLIFLNNCMTYKKCIKYCESTGSKGYRWFMEGCCQCVGPNCYGYGLNENRCIACQTDPFEDEDLDDDIDGLINIAEYDMHDLDGHFGYGYNALLPYN